MANFPCPVCGDNRGAVDQSCAKCGWSYKAPDLRMGVCPMCGCERFTWGHVRGRSRLKFLSDSAGLVEKSIDMLGLQVKARLCNDCGNVQLFSERP